MEILKTTRELIEELRGGSCITTSDGIVAGHKSPTNIEVEAANKLEQLLQIIDDMNCDHYVDYLDWYMNRCRELEEELEEMNKHAVDNRTGEGATDCL